MTSSAPLLYLVDDDPGWLRALARNLRQAGAEVEVFETRSALLARVDEELPDGIVIDFDLGAEGTGAVIARRLRQDLLSSCPRIVLLTAQLPEVDDVDLVVFDAAYEKSTAPGALVAALLAQMSERVAARSAPRLRGEPTGELGRREDPENDRASG